MRSGLTIALAMAVTGGPLAAQTPPAPAPRASGPQLVRKPISDQVDTTVPDAPVNGIVYLYGNQRCPTDSSGNEIVVCERRSAAERYLIPKEVRPGSMKPEYESFAVRSQGILDAGQAGIGTCTNVGPGGGTGCFQQRANNWAAQKEAKKVEGTVP